MKKGAQDVGHASNLPVARASLPAVATNHQDAKSQLPDGWRLVKLEEVVTPHNAFWGAEEPFPESIEAIVLGVGNITNHGNIRLNGAPKRYLARGAGRFDGRNPLGGFR